MFMILFKNNCFYAVKLQSANWSSYNNYDTIEKELTGQSVRLCSHAISTSKVLVNLKSQHKQKIVVVTFHLNNHTLADVTLNLTQNFKHVIKAIRL